MVLAERLLEEGPLEEGLPDAAMPGRIDAEPAHSRAAGGVGLWRITVADKHLVWIAVLFAIVVLAIHSVVIHPWMLDDAFISFRYAHNLSGGDGPVYNPGERVEGYTCFLCCLPTLAASLRASIGPYRLSRRSFSVPAALSRLGPRAAWK